MNDDNKYTLFLLFIVIMTSVFCYCTQRFFIEPESDWNIKNYDEIIEVPESVNTYGLLQTGYVENEWWIEF